jgi:hypothetical protein
LELTTGTKWVAVTTEEKVRKAESLLVLKLTESNYSFASFDSIPEICKVAFVDSEIAQNLTLNSTNSYVAVHGFAPYVKREFEKEIQQSSSPFFTIYFDKTTTSQVKKQLDIHVGYWSDKFGKAVIVYLESVFSGHADGDTSVKSIMEFLENINLQHQNLLNFSMDGPAVNIAFLRKITAQFNANDNNHLPLVDSGTCSLHPVHTTFGKVIESLPFDINQQLNDIYTVDLSCHQQKGLTMLKFSVICYWKASAKSSSGQ